MKEFQIMRYLKKYKTVIAVLSVVMGILFYLFAQFFFQTYTASTVIEFSNEAAADGYAPDGTPIDTNEIKSSNIVSAALDNLNISQTNMDSIRGNTNIEPIVSEEEQLLLESKLELGEEYVLNPTKYLVTLSADVLEGKEYPRLVLNEILSEYATYYGETHVNTQGVANGISDIYSKNYDYIEMMEEIDNSLESTLKYLNDKMNENSTFRAYGTGYTFSDLSEEFSLIKNIKSAQIASNILSNTITKDRDVLLKKYHNRNNNLTINNETASDEIEKIKGVIESYVEMMSNSDNTNITSDYILDDVHENYLYDDEGNLQGTDQTTEYDRLLEGYVSNRSTYENNLIDLAYNEYVISVFEKAPAESPQEEQTKTEESIRLLVDEINRLYDILYKTNNEYNEYLGAQNIKVLSSVGVAERIPVELFTAFVIIIFGVVGCVGAVLLGRVEDIIEYYAFTNKVDGLPNRAKCDRYISAKSRKALSSQFVCAVFQITNLREENIRHGRAVGDQILKTFADILVDVFEPSESNFVAYNGSGQHIVFLDKMSKAQMDACLSQLTATVSQRCEEEKYTISFQSGVAFSEEEKCYNIRKLLSIAMTRVNNGDSDLSYKEAAATESETEKTLDAPQKTEKTEKIDLERAKEDYYEKFKRLKNGR